jgi:hypothetical protein
LRARNQARSLPWLSSLFCLNLARPDKCFIFSV